MTFNEKVWTLTLKIPKGKISTYKDIAHAMDTKAYRAIGTALSKNPFAPTVPCHRVISSAGKLHGFKGKKNDFSTLNEKADLLKKEGIELKKINLTLSDYEVINLKKYLFKF